MTPCRIVIHLETHSPAFFAIQRDFLSKTLGSLPVDVLKDLGQRMLLVAKDSDMPIGDFVVRIFTSMAYLGL